MNFTDKGMHCGTHVIFAVSKKNDGSYVGDIRVLDNPKHSIQTASPMVDTVHHAPTEAGVLALLEACLSDLVREAQ